jgi:epidermal growth factor receptor substrate 15
MKRFKLNLLRFLLVNVFLLQGLFLFSQESEADIKAKAEKSFKNENYVEASKLYSQLLAFNKTDAFYNYRYGVCLIYNSRKKQDAIKHLIFASKEPNFDPEVYFYLGKAYHLNFEFGEAIQYYETYKSKVGSKINVTLDVNRQIEMSQNGKRLLSSVNEMVVLDKIEIEAKRFFDIYDLKNIGGDIIVNAQFQSKLDKKKNHTPIIHFPAKPSTIYYSSYGEDESSGKDIFIRRKLPDGSWSLPQTISGDVNTKFDEDFPYMHPNGNYLYFCSKGHNSMGGYDVFRSKLNKETNTFEKAENLDFAISSPDDDLFYVVDSLDKFAYFASARQSLDGKIHVYKVRVDQVPIQIAVIKSAFSSTINPANKKVSVEVFDFASNTKIGTFNASEKGNVLLTFPKGGKYEYQMKVDGVATVFKTTINVPFQSEFKPLKQKMIHELGESGETVRVLNLFDETVEDPIATMVEIARIRSELNPNSSQFDLKSLDEKTNNKDVYAKIGFDKLSDREVKENINQLAVIQENQTKNLKEIQQKAIDKVLQNVEEIKSLQAELKTSAAELDKASPAQKKELLEKSGSIVNELNRLEKESKLLIPFSDSLSNVISKSEEEDKKARNLANQIAAAFDKNDLILMSQKINDNAKQIIELKNDKSDLVSESVLNDIVAKKAELKKVQNSEKEFLDMKVRAKNELIDLDIKLSEAKSKDKPAIQKKIDEKENDIVYIDNELKEVKSKNEKKRAELAVIEEKLAFIQEIQNSKAPTTNTSSTKAKEILLASDNQNTKTLKTYIAKQVEENKLDLATMKYNKAPSNQNVSNISLSAKEYSKNDIDVINKLAPDYFKVLESIKNDKDLTEEQKMKFSQKEDKNLKFLLSKEINSTEEALKLTPSDAALKSKLADLRAFNEDINNNIAFVQNNLEEKFPETNLKKKLSDKQMANRVKPNHFVTLMVIEGDGQLSDNQRLENSQKEDQEFIRLLSLEKNKINEKLKSKPNDEIFLHEISLINSLLSETDKRIEKRTMGMASFNISENKTQDDYLIKAQKEKEDELKRLGNNTENKNSETKTNENLANENKTQKEKEDELKRLGNNTENKNSETKTNENLANENKTQKEKEDELKLLGNNTENKNSETKTNENLANENKTQKEKEDELKRLGNNTENKNSETKTNENLANENKTQKEKEDELKRLGNNTENKNSETKTNENLANENKAQKDKEDELKRLGITVDNNNSKTTSNENKSADISSTEILAIKEISPAYEKKHQ